MTETRENGDKASSQAIKYSAGVQSEATIANGKERQCLKSMISAVDQSITASFRVDNVYHTYIVTAKELGVLSDQRTRMALANTLESALKEHTRDTQEDISDEEAPSDDAVVKSNVLKLANHLKELEENGPYPEHSPEAADEDKTAEVAANALATVLLHSSPEYGISQKEVESRRAVFGTNAIADKKTESFCKLCWEAVQDFVLIMLIVLGVITIIIETTIGLEDGKKCGACWIEGAAILVAVGIVVLVTASIDYAKQFAFIKLTRSLHDTNVKSVIRDGKQIGVTDDDIVVGDILSINSHNLASIPADCVLLGPVGDLKMDESSLTGESNLIRKKPGDVVLSGTTASQGSGKLVVIAVGVNSVAGKIKAQVYESEDYVDTLSGDGEDSPLFAKLNKLAKQIGLVGTFCALLAFTGMCIIGLGIRNEAASRVVDYLVVAITVLAVAVPEGLPLAVTLALAFSSSKMMKEQNLVKHLDACETMGCATTICTDKTGTLTANKMTARAVYVGMKNYLVDEPSVRLGDYMKTFHGGVSSQIIELIAEAISICTMDETVLYLDESGKVEGASGNPTEVALLQLVHDLELNYVTIREKTRGRADQGPLAEYLSEGKHFGFSSARKMMSWAVPQKGGGYRLYCKGAQEVVLARCMMVADENAESVKMTDEQRDDMNSVALAFSRRGMRCLAVAYRDLPPGFDLDSLSTSVKNSDGSEAYIAETDLVAIGLVGIEDPLRSEVPDAIEKCYTAGIDVRLVTGDNPNTAVSIAFQAGILRPCHFVDKNGEMVATNLKENVMMEGKTFREKVYRHVDGEKEFDQSAFDRIWPSLRVLARSSPDDKLTLAHGLNQSNLYVDKAVCDQLLRQDGIKIFPDRQVVAMTGDGTNDAPALKRADIGFAMGLTGTQIAKDAADIILLDDNFASIVTAAKWGRNVYASIQKFLQFQLTVNISAVVTALTGAFAYQTSPLAAIQLLWVNLLMDSLASLALASEPPVDALLKRPPVNRTDHMITKHMWANMLGQASYQIVVVMLLLFEGPVWFNIPPGHVVEAQGQNSVHYTLIFNAFVWMQLFNEINSRKLNGEFNVFKGLLNNALFCGILLITSILQVIIVEFGSVAFHVSEGGLTWKYWVISLAFGMGSLPVQQVINVLYRICSRYKSWRNMRRVNRNYALQRRSINRHIHRD